MPTESPEVIEQQIVEKRREMLTKVDDLTSRTTGTVREAVHSLTDLTGAVSSTVDTVSETVGRIGRMANPAAVSEVIRDTVGAIPLSSTVREKPWASVGGAVLAGFVTGMVASRIGRTSPSPAPATGYGPAATAVGATTAARPSAFSSLFDQLIDRIGLEVRNVAQAAVDTAGKAVTSHIAELGGKLAPEPAASHFRSGV